MRMVAWARPRNAWRASSASAVGSLNVGMSGLQMYQWGWLRGAPDGSDLAAQRQRGGGERLRLLADQHTGLARGLDRGLLDRGDRRFQFLERVGRHRDQPGVAKHPMPGGQVRLLLEHVVVLGGLRSVFDLPDAGALGRVADVLGLLAANVACSLIGAQRGADQRERPMDAATEQHWREEPRMHHRAWPLRNPDDEIGR